MVSGNRNTVVKRTGMWSPIEMRVTDFRPPHHLWHRWLGNIQGTSDCQNSGSIKEVWGDVFFPFLSGFSLKSAKLNKKIPQGLLELVSSKVHAMSESPWADGQSLPWGCTSITCGPWRHTSSKLSVLNTAGEGPRNWEKRRIVWIWHSTGPLWARGGHPSRHCGLTSCLILFSPCMEFVDLQQQIHLFHNANDTVEIWVGWIWRYPQPKCISAARLFSNAA